MRNISNNPSKDIKKDIKKILIIAGSDPSGGAGVQADIKTAAAHKVFSSSVITCLTAQNTKGVYAIHNSPVNFLRQQLETILDDIKFDVIKIGMLGTVEIIDCVSDVLQKKAKNIPVILDTVMVATSGDLLLEKSAVKSLKEKLIKNSYLVTPNADEAKVLANMPINNLKDMKEAAKKIQNLGCKSVLVKGGHLNFSDAKIKNLLLDEKGIFHIITNKKVESNSIHGTGCSLASAVACNITKKMELVDGVKSANRYIYRSILKRVRLGKGSDILTHF